jgi:hypothetical protein
LLITVLLALVGASIAVVILSQTLFATTSSVSSAQGVEVNQALTNAEGGFESALSANPYFWETTVFADPGDSVAERARVCSSGVAVQPGSAWPAGCGTYWTYAPATGTFPEQVVVQITPPSASNALLTVTFLAHSGCPAGVNQPNLSTCTTEAGQTLSFRLGDAGAFTIFSSSGVLNLNALAPNEPSGGASSPVLSGTIYSSGAMALAQSGVASASGATFEAEGGFLGSTTSSGNVYATQGASGCTAQPSVGTLGGQTLENIRCLQPNVLHGNGLSTGVLQAVEAACMPTSSVNLSVGSTSYSSELCLREGQGLMTTSGSVVAIPTSLNGYLLLPGANAGGTSNGARTVDIYTYTDTSGATPNGTLPSSAGNCAITCSLPGQAAGSSPGLLGYWSLLGTFWLPESGIISTDADTVVGLCGVAFSTNASCTSAPASVGGFTIIAGTPSQPHDLYVGGSTPNYTNNVAFEATGDVVFPYWDHAKAASLTTNVFSDKSVVFVDASLLALGKGHGDQSTSGIVSDPVSVPYRTANESALLEVVGSIESTSVNLGQLGLFANFALSTPASLYAAPAPWFTGPEVSWDSTNSSTLPVSGYAALGG